MHTYSLWWSQKIGQWDKLYLLTEKGEWNEKPEKTVQSWMWGKSRISRIENEETVAEVSKRLGVHPTIINNWKKSLLEGAANIFDKGNKAKKQNETQVNDLYR
jgi:hypothetical protein